MIDEEQVISATQSICPVCLIRIPALCVRLNGEVYLRKTCPEHGSFQTIIWRGKPEYTEWNRPKLPAYPTHPFTSVQDGCPFDCGLCPDHRQQTCTALLEITQRCDLRCSFCFANAGTHPTPDPDPGMIESWYHRLLESNGPCNIQLSGGEPTMRDDLPEIIALGQSLGFGFIQLNTHGLRLAQEPGYAKKLKQAGLSSIFLQFDGTHDEIFKKIRGVNLLDRKQAAIRNCAENDLGVVLVPTLISGVNTSDIGNIIRFALEYFPTVRGVHFQPVSYFGRYPTPPSDKDRFTIPEVIQAVELQTNGLIKAENLTTSGCENALCSLHG
ncbi:MAG: radical SAM protein, partial [Anaerolineae bacterium]|nr:radical SAM protein [Anaerolineae bacterium]